MTSITITTTFNLSNDEIAKLKELARHGIYHTGGRQGDILDALCYRHGLATEYSNNWVAINENGKKVWLQIKQSKA